MKRRRGKAGQKIVIRGKRFGKGGGKVLLVTDEVQNECLVKVWKSRKIKALIPKSANPGIAALFVVDAGGMKSKEVKHFKIKKRK